MFPNLSDLHVCIVGAEDREGGSQSIVKTDVNLASYEQNRLNYLPDDILKEIEKKLPPYKSYEQENIKSYEQENIVPGLRVEYGTSKANKMIGPTLLSDIENETTKYEIREAAIQEFTGNAKPHRRRAMEIIVTLLLQLEGINKDEAGEKWWMFSKYKGIVSDWNNGIGLVGAVWELLVEHMRGNRKSRLYKHVPVLSSEDWNDSDLLGREAAPKEAWFVSTPQALLEDGLTPERLYATERNGNYVNAFRIKDRTESKEFKYFELTEFIVQSVYIQSETVACALALLCNDGYDDGIPDKRGLLSYPSIKSITAVLSMP